MTKKASSEDDASLVQYTSDIVTVLGADGTFRYGSPSVERVLGYQPQERIGANAFEYIHPDDVERVSRALIEGLGIRGVHPPIELRFRHCDGSWRYLEVVANNLLDDPYVSGIVLTSRDITERKQAEKAIRESKERFEQLFDRSVDTLLVHDENGRMIDCNVEACRSLGYTREEMLSLSVSDFAANLMSGDEIPKSDALWRHVPASELTEVVAGVHLAEHRRKDGTTFPVEVRVSFIDYGGERMMLAAAHDITSLKRAAEALQESEEQFRSLVQYSLDVISILEPDGTVRYASPSIERVLGYRPEERMGARAFDNVHPDDAELVSHAFAKVLADPSLTPFLEYRFRHADGSWRYLETISNNLLDDRGVRGIVITSRDITERKRTEMQLKESERKYRSVVDNLKEVIFQTDVQGFWTFLNPAWEEITGFSVEESIGTNFLDYVHHDDRQRNLELFRPLIEREKDYCRYEIRYLTKGGGFRWIEVWARLTLSDEDTITGTSGTLNDVTERKKAEDKVRRSESRLAEAQHIAHIGNWEYEVERDEAYWSDEMYRIFGFAPQEFTPTYKTLSDAVHPDDKGFIRRLARRILYEGEQYSIDFRIVRPDGDIRAVYAQHEVVRSETGRPIRLVGTVHDVTERKRTEEELRRSEARNKAILEATPDLMFIHSRDGKYLDIQANAPGKLYLPRDTLIGSNMRDLLPPEVVAPFLGKIALTLDTGEVQTYEYRLDVPEGTLDFEARLVVSGHDEVLCAVRDVTERKILEEQLAHQAFQDSLTDLPNRALFMDRLGHALAQADRRGGKVAVLFVDLDNFNFVNDSLGHEVGDQLLVAVAERLRTCLRPGDTAARLGGDEFTILLEGVGVREATQVAERVAEVLRAPFDLDGREVFTSASIGIVLNTTNQDEPGDLLRNSDLAMYQAKGSGKARYTVFDPSMSIRALEYLELGNDLRRALQRDEFQVFYQPKVLLETGKVLSVEALVRWEHPERGLLLPSDFVPVAEETGLILYIGQRVLEEACRQARAWQEQCSGDPVMVSVNLSAKQFQHSDLAQDIAQVLRETGLAPRNLCLEITESAVMQDVKSTTATLQELKAMGVEFAIDDFGTGYSSLSYLKRFPVGFLKIDRSFIDELEKDPDDTMLVSGMITLAHSLGMRVVAEGVETAEQLARLREMGCDVAQGNYFSEPVSSRAMTSFLADGLPL